MQHKFLGKVDNTNSYSGIPMLCTSGVHEKVFEMLVSSNQNKKCKILVLGSGSGAFEQRLIDNDYNNIVSVDIETEKFLVKSVKPIKFNLNNDFSCLGRFDVIVAIEVIEHLENQFHFMRCVSDMLNDRGVVYLTTPNVESDFARIKFFLSGKAHYFGNLEMIETGHINPIFLHILSYSVNSCGMKIKNHTTNGNLWTRMLKYERIPTRVIYFIMFFLSRFIPRKNNFEINIFEICKK